METQIHNQPTAKIPLPAHGRVIVDNGIDENQYEESMIDLDDFEFSKMFTPNIKVDISPSNVNDISLQVDKLLAKGKSLSALNDKYIEKFVVKGNQELYELLGSIYGFMLSINESAIKEHILRRMREHLSETDNIKLSESSSIEATVVRYIMPKDRQTSFNYARVMKVAFLENIAAKDLAGYITGRGGITKIQDTLANEEAAVEAKKVTKTKLSLFKKILLANAKTITSTVEIPRSKTLNLVPSGSKEALFEFALVDNSDGDNYRIHQVVNVPEAIGEQWLNYISQSVINDDVEMVKKGLDKLRAKLGITGGYGMEPGDIGYQSGVMNQQANDENKEISVNDDEEDLSTEE